MNEKLLEIMMLRASVNKYLDKNAQRDREILEQISSIIRYLNDINMDDEVCVILEGYFKQIRRCATRNMFEMSPSNFWEMIGRTLDEG